MIINDNNGNEDHENDGDFDAVLDKRNCDENLASNKRLKAACFHSIHHYLV
jgi:hypothetical protein